MNEDNYQGGAGGGISGARRLVYDKASNSWIGGGGGTGPSSGGSGEAAITLGPGGGGGGGVGVPVDPRRGEPVYTDHPDGPVPVDLGEPGPDEGPDGASWILTAAGNVFLCSTVGATQSIEHVAGTSGYFDSLTLIDVTPEQRTAILAGVRAWLAGQEAIGGA